MMTLALAGILVREVAVMFLLIGTGILTRKTGLLSEENARALSNVLLLIVIPFMVLNSLQTERSPALYPAMGLAFVMAVLYHAGAIFAANRLIRDRGESTTAWRVSRLAVVFSNAGFMGFPLLLATVGQEGLLFGAMYVGVFNAVSWIWSVPALTGKRGLSLRKLLTNPSILGFLLGMILYFAGIRLPAVMGSFASYLASVNTPLSMLIIGVFLASVRPREVLSDRGVHWVVFLRNIGLPLVTLLLLWLSRVSLWLPGGRILALSVLILVSCPSGTMSILMSARYGCDSGHGSKIVTLSTLLAIVTMPLVILLADTIL